MLPKLRAKKENGWMAVVRRGGRIDLAHVIGVRGERPRIELLDSFRIETDEAEALHRRLLPLFRGLFVESNPGPVKFLLAAMGLIENELRLPLVAVEPGTEKVVLEAARAAGVDRVLERAGAARP